MYLRKLIKMIEIEKIMKKIEEYKGKFEYNENIEEIKRRFELTKGIKYDCYYIYGMIEAYETLGNENENLLKIICYLCNLFFEEHNVNKKSNMMFG